MMFDRSQVADLPYRSARQELERLRHIPHYSVPLAYFLAVAERAAETARGPREVAAVVSAASGRIHACREHGEDVGAFWALVGSTTRP